MIHFSQLIKNIDNFFIKSNAFNELHQSNIDIPLITNNSKEIIDNGIFFAINENSFKYLLNDIKNTKLFCIIADVQFQNHDLLIQLGQNTQIIFIQNINIRKIYGEFICTFYQLDQFPLKICAITGTNGKSSTAFFYKQLCNFINLQSCSIGTIGIYSDDEEYKELSLTTPDIGELSKIISQKAKNKIYDIAIEASSHGLDQYRIDGIKIEVAGFTNFSQDHLDYHKSMDDYWLAKKRLFTELNIKKIAFNDDDKKANEICEICKTNSCEYITYGKSKNSDIQLLNSYIDENFRNIIEMKIFNQKYKLSTHLIGEFQIYNLMLATGMLFLSHKDDIGKLFPQKSDGEINLLGLKSPPGRMEMTKINQGSIAIIDYAHSPDALQTLLINIKNTFIDKKILLIFGCGGNRDKEKRRIMGEIAENLADFIVITDDNPRHEEPHAIRNEILSGIANTDNTKEIEDRREAIKFGLNFSITNNYILVIAGKGHENYQIIGDKKIEFNDKNVLLELIG